MTRAPAAIGTLHAQSASLWFLAIDAKSAAAWNGDKGYDYEADPFDRDDDPSDFGRAMKIAGKKQRAISVGKAQGVIVTVGGCGWSAIWRIDGGIMLVDHAPGEDIDERAAATIERVGTASLEAKAKGKPRSIGKLQISSGVLALLLPAELGNFTAAQIKKAAGAVKVVGANPSRALVSLPNGNYDCFVDRLAFDGDLGSIESRIRIVTG